MKNNKHIQSSKGDKVPLSPSYLIDLTWWPRARQGLPFPSHRGESRLGEIKPLLITNKQWAYLDLQFKSCPYLWACGFFITAHPESSDGPHRAKGSSRSVAHSERRECVQNMSGAGWGWVYSFSVIAVTNYHKFSTLKTVWIYSLTYFGGQKFEISVTGQKSMCHRDASSYGRICSPLAVSGGCWHFLAVVILFTSIF